MKKIKKNKTIDYSKFFEKPASAKALAGEGEKIPEEEIPEKGKKFSFTTFFDWVTGGFEK